MYRWIVINQTLFIRKSGKEDSLEAAKEAVESFPPGKTAFIAGEGVHLRRRVHHGTAVWHESSISEILKVEPKWLAGQEY